MYSIATCIYLYTVHAPANVHYGTTLSSHALMSVDYSSWTAISESRDLRHQRTRRHSLISVTRPRCEWLICSVETRSIARRLSHWSQTHERHAVRRLQLNAEQTASEPDQETGNSSLSLSLALPLYYVTCTGWYISITAVQKGHTHADRCGATQRRNMTQRLKKVNVVYLTGSGDQQLCRVTHWPRSSNL